LFSRLKWKQNFYSGGLPSRNYFATTVLDFLRLDFKLSQLPFDCYEYTRHVWMSQHLLGWSDVTDSYNLDILAITKLFFQR
jgi:hypothetical protein